MGRYIDQQLPFIGVNKISLAFNNVAILRTDVRTRLFKNHYLTAIVTKLGPLSFDVSSSNISKTVNLYFSLGDYF